MKLKALGPYSLSIVSILLGVGCGMPAIAASPFEVWLVDQSNSPGLNYGGNIAIYDGSALTLGSSPLSGVTPQKTIDLSGLGGQTGLCSTTTGTNPVRPHMLLFNSTYTHAVLSFVASGHVAIFDTATYDPVACLRTAQGVGGVRQAHAAFPALDDSYILVANQNGKLLERIDTNYQNNLFTLNPAATLNLATCTTPNGNACEQTEVRPDNAPICPMLNSSSNLGFITLRGGGLFVVDPKSNPMKILAEYDRTTVHGNGCGGIETGGSMYINSGAGSQSENPSEFDVYQFPLSGYSPSNLPNQPGITTIFSDDTTPMRDSHGMIAVGEYLWVADRGLNLIEVFDITSNNRVNTIDLIGETPDLIDISPDGNQVYISLRGPNPLSGSAHVAAGTTPGLMVIDVLQGGKTGQIKGVIPISNIDRGIERADGHGIRVRQIQPVPEPSSTLSLLALGTLGAGSVLQRQQKQKSAISVTDKL